jgi:cell division protein FtsB
MTRKQFTVITVIAAIAAVLIILLPGYTKLQDLKAENRELEYRIKKLGKSIDELKDEKTRLQDDILYIEKVARERLGVVREDEVVIKKK